MSTNEFQCRTSLRVRWSEVDMQKIVFNGHYLNYIDVAIGDYWRAIGLPYPQGYVDRYNKGEGDADFNRAGAVLHSIYSSTHFRLI